MEIQKYVYADPRITTPDSAYPIIKGATNQITKAVTSVNYQSTSQQRYEWNAPAIDIFNGLDVKQHLVFVLQFTVTITAGGNGTGALPLAGSGTNFSLCANPLSAMLRTVTVTINGIPLVSQQVENVHSELLRLQAPKNSVYQSYPSNLDNLATYEKSAININNVMSDYSNAVPDVYSGNGAYPCQFCDNTGTPLQNSNPGVLVNTNGCNYCVLNGVPVASLDGATIFNNGQTRNIFVRYDITEPVAAEPFAHFFNPDKVNSSINGVNKISMVFDMKNDISRVLRTNSAETNFVISGITLLPLVTSELIVKSYNKNLTDLELYNPRCVLPYMRYDADATRTPGQNLAYNATTTLVSANYTFQEVPSYFMIFVKPSQYATTPSLSAGFGEWKFEIQNVSLDGCVGMGAQIYTKTQQELYEMTVRNGIHMDYVTWLGTAMTSTGAVQTCGSIVLIKTGIDFYCGEPELTAGVNAPNMQVQFRVRIRNNSPTAVTSDLLLYTVPIFMEKIIVENGQMVIIKAPITSEDVLNVNIPKSLGDNGDELLTGNGFFDSLKNMFNKAKSIYDKSKPYVSAIKNALPDGKVKSAMSSIGYGKIVGGNASAKYC